MRYVLLYENGNLSKAQEYFPAHQARWKEFQKLGSLLLIGPFTPPSKPGAMAVFSNRAAAEEFARTDPFVLHGVVASWRILEWKEALSGP